MRTRKKKWAPGELENNPRILRDESRFAGRLREFFGNDRPIHLELGCGKGRFIIETSRRNPDVNFIAIERDETILATAARRAEENAASPSLFFVLADVNDGLEFIRPGEISRLYINFCDPWPTKKKRARRRLTHENFLKLYEKLEIPEIFFKTDNRILFEASLESFSRAGWLVKNISLDLHALNSPDNIMTEYEEKFSPFGPIYRLEAEPRSC
ncbi:MAG: tRNA (guanosine(46)-N7)-methyltransferase TrmB [Defluviitaleaceae bacterium]|nr:tRNA (guanosine(46)-N7)-methyltransferase TrmB [Defluviitaleaceae bacterium]